MHHYLEKYNFGECYLDLQADNCSGQNKNNGFIFYLCWRILKGLNQSINYNFLLTGHTKFSPDRCFGLLKKNFGRRFSSSLFDIANVVGSSSVAGTNVAEICCLPDGRVLIPVFDWTTFFKKLFKRIPNIKMYHHFKLVSSEPGTVYCKEYASSETEYRHVLLKQGCSFDSWPVEVKPKGLTRERKEYLFKEIRSFCRSGTEESCSTSCND